jgi:hypothetical protein
MAEPAQQPGSGLSTNAASGVPVPPALRVQILATEHWSLLATRSLAWNEVFTRAGMLLSALAGAIVALALVGQGSGFGPTFVTFGIVILPVVLFIGEATYARIGDSNTLDAMAVVGMNRIRHAYLEIAPDLEPYFVTSSHDDIRGVGVTMGVRPGGSQLAHLMSATPVVVMVINGVVAGAIAGLVLVQVGLGGPVAIALSILAFAVVLGLHAAHGRRWVARSQASVVSRFPGGSTDATW